MRNHKDLRAFILADELVIEIYQLTKSFPLEEQFGITFQIRKAAVSITSNIVEGCSRESQKEFHRFLEIAYSSLRELHYQVDLAMRLGFSKNQNFESWLSKANETEKVLGGLMRKMRCNDLKNV